MENTTEAILLSEESDEQKQLEEAEEEEDQREEEDEETWNGKALMRVPREKRMRIDWSRGGKIVNGKG